MQFSEQRGNTIHKLDKGPKQIENGGPKAIFEQQTTKNIFWSGKVKAFNSYRVLK